MHFSQHRKKWTAIMQLKAWSKKSTWKTEFMWIHIQGRRESTSKRRIDRTLIIKKLSKAHTLSVSTSYLYVASQLHPRLARFNEHLRLPLAAWCKVYSHKIQISILGGRSFEVNMKHGRATNLELLQSRLLFNQLVYNLLSLANPWKKVSQSSHAGVGTTKNDELHSTILITCHALALQN